MEDDRGRFKKEDALTTLRTAAQQALEAMDKATRFMSYSDYEKLDEAIDALRAALAEPDTCTWHEDEDEHFETSCGHIFQTLEGTAEDNGFKHCCFCGNTLVQELWTEDRDE